MPNRLVKVFMRGCLALIAVALCASARAAIYCVDTPNNFRAALIDAAANGEDNLVKVVAGTYALTSTLFYSTSSTHDLTIVGGYGAACASVTRGATLLDGQNSVRPLHIIGAHTSVVIQGLEFIAGLSTNNRGGGLSIANTSGDVRVELNTFIGNRADDLAGALFVVTSGQLVVRNNVFLGNSGATDGAAELSANGTDAFVTSNTFLGNSADTQLSPGALRVGGSAHFNVSNNLLWNNNSHNAVDFHADTGHLDLNNDIASADGLNADAASAGNLSVDPQIASCGFLCFSYRLKRSSPLIDAGINMPPGGVIVFDIYYTPRIIGGTVDIGAVELDVLFADGFE